MNKEMCNESKRIALDYAETILLVVLLARQAADGVPRKQRAHTERHIKAAIRLGKAFAALSE